MGPREFWVGLSPGDALTHEASRCGDAVLESQHSGGGNKGSDSKVSLSYLERIKQNKQKTPGFSYTSLSLK